MRQILRFAQDDKIAPLEWRAPGALRPGSKAKGWRESSIEQHCDRTRETTLPLNIDLFAVSTWVIPVLLAITLHEAAHGFVAHLFGDDTAWNQGRVTFNPFRHVDPFGTVLLPGLLLLMRSPFLFGYAKPVPVNFRALRHPRRDMIWVAAAGPAMNILQATLAALLFHLVGALPAGGQQWVAANLVNAIDLNVILAVFNMIPLPPLDGGRVAVGILPNPLARPLARLEPYGMAIIIGLLFFLPIVSARLGWGVDIFRQLIREPANEVIRFILQLTGNM